MKKYTPEEKAQALDMMEKLGTKHTSQTLKITDTTLYRWRREAELAALIPPQMEAAEQVQEQSPAEEADTLTNGMQLLESTAESKPVQHTDGLLQQALETIRCLDEENSRLIDMIQQLRTALRTLAGGGLTVDPFAQIKVYESVADFIKSNPDRLYRFWVYKHIFTPDEIEKKYIDQTPYEESRCRMGVIREVIPLPDGDLLIGFAEIYESLAELGADNRAMAYFRLSEIRVNYLPMDGDTYAAED